MDREALWSSLGLDLEAHAALLEALGPLYQEVYLSQENRPRGMAYFDAVVADIHGARVAELLQIREAGRPVVGTFCVFVPEEIVWAAGGACVGLCAGVEVATERVEEVLPRNLCPLIKAFFGFKLARLCPYMEVCHFLVGETTCDGKKKAYEIFEAYKPIYVMQVPHRKDEESLKLWIAEVERFLRYMEEFTGESISAEALREAIELINRRRRALKRLNELRRFDPPPISGRDVLLIHQLSFFDDPERFTRKLEELCAELEERVSAGEGVCPAGTPRVVISGCPMAIPNWKVAHLVESSGAVIVGEESCVGTRYTRELVRVSENSKEGLLRALAERYFRIDCAIFTPNPERPAHLKEMVRDLSAAGVIHYALKFCDPYTIEAYRIEKDSAVPVLKIETDYSLEDREQLRTRIEAFLEVLR
ncbi:MAG TPA: 2-hydroxyacyl-CoA dehydratase [Thermosulfurimonas dismutans]|uniref:2-hydroxyacyl-CoA dehydratase n=1 Tax=Thermosulfurimonas dismutans TaxID=999894 RepID=A0A7C3GFB0_9BACT|nr:2-hydroxyacyl-CoA dehydratase [Thermosulfurimonas dismutans]